VPAARAEADGARLAVGARQLQRPLTRDLVSLHAFISVDLAGGVANGIVDELRRVPVAAVRTRAGPQVGQDRDEAVLGDLIREGALPLVHPDAVLHHD